MTLGRDELQRHEKFKELCAMSVAGNLTANESAELGAHMEACEECRAVYQEYRVLAKEGMPMLAKILAVRQGFKCTVLFAIDPADGTINPQIKDNIPGLEALQSADLLVAFFRAGMGSSLWV